MADNRTVALELFDKGYNCAQAVFCALSEDCGVSPEMALRLTNGFGGGIRYGDTCGAVSGAIMAIGMKCGFHVEKDFVQKGYCNRKTVEFLEKFKQECGSTLCREILGCDIYTPEDHFRPEVREMQKIICPKAVSAAFRVLESMDFEQK